MQTFNKQISLPYVKIAFNCFYHCRKFTLIWKYSKNRKAIENCKIKLHLARDSVRTRTNFRKFSTYISFNRFGVDMPHGGYAAVIKSIDKILLNLIQLNLNIISLKV